MNISSRAFLFLFPTIFSKGSSFSPVSFEFTPIVRNQFCKYTLCRSVSYSTTAKISCLKMSNPSIHEAHIMSLTYREMQKLCKERGLAANGNTNAIRDRLLADSQERLLPETPKQKTRPSRNEDGGLHTPDLSVENSPSINELTTPKRKTSKPKTSSSSRKRQKIVPGSLTPPKDWESIWSLVEELRADKSAPVDSDGGQELPETHLGEKVYRYQVLVALMLSSQTKDAVVGEAMRKLQKHGLTVENIHATDDSTLNSLIRKVGFHNNKTKYLKQVAETLISKYDSDIPRSAKEMMELSGIGPKMAYIIENICFGTSSGIGVDTHMHRMFNDLRWVKSNTPEQTREQLEGWLPREKWGEVNYLWVGFGQESQQQKEKMLHKALKSSRPLEAFKLLNKVGLNVKKEAKRFNLEKEVADVYKKSTNRT